MKANATKSNTVARPNLLNAKIVQAMGRLTRDEKAIISCRFGITDGQVKTLKEVGTKLNLAPEVIQEAEAKMLRLTQDLVEEGVRA